VRYALVAFDLDGTLLAPDGAVPVATHAFLEELGRSARVTLATGRSLASARRYVVDLGITTPVILYHGAVVWDPKTGAPLREHRIPPDLARRALAAALRFPIHPQLYRAVEDPTIYVAHLTPPIRAFLARENRKAQAVGDLAPWADQGPLKLLFIGDPLGLGEAEDALRQAVPELTVVRSEREYVEVLPPGVCKGEALAWLCVRLGIPLERVVAVGDQPSDLSMIERAGLGVAMAHAPEEVRAKADVVIAAIPSLQRILGMAGGDPRPRRRPSVAL
jgi:Cof subfamily protein (haloacid dehalogenase superfamily)